MTKSNGITSLKQAAKLLNKHSPDGESLAYINPEEAKLLRASGGSGIMTVAGVPSYDHKWWHTALQWVGDKIMDTYTAPKGDDDKPVYDDKGRRIEAPRSIVQDAFSIWAGLRAKKEQEGLNEAEMTEFNRLNEQLTAAKTEFDVSTDFGTQLQAPTNVASTVSDVAAYRPIDFSGSATPDLTTTPVAQGGRIGAFNGGIQGLMPQQAMPQQAMPQQAMPQQAMPQQGFMPQQGMPRMGYAAQGGRIGFNSGGETAYEKWLIDKYDLLVSDLSWDDHSKYSKLFRDQKAQGGRIGYNSGSQGSRYTYLTDKISKGIPLTPPELEELQMLEITYADVDRDPSAQGGRIGYNLGGIDRPFQGVGALNRMGYQEGGGIMPLLDMGGMEKDYRQEGGFVPIGRKEKADDVPARLSKNEFVFTADAVKAAGGGDIDEGAQRMYNVMKNLEAGGEISEQSQGQA
jgi:hypothetical protein